MDELQALAEKQHKVGLRLCEVSLISYTKYSPVLCFSLIY